MATLTLIGEPFPDSGADAARSATIALTAAVAVAAPRDCSAHLLIARNAEVPSFGGLLVPIEAMPMSASVLPQLWRSSPTARPLDGEFVHAMTPLVPLRPRKLEDGSQTSVLIPHALGWLAPDEMGKTAARRYRTFVRRAVKLADALLAPTHATAAAVRERYGMHLDVQVLPLAPPPEYLAAPDAPARREALALPDRYLLTDAPPGENGRLEVIFDVMLDDLQLPELVILTTQLDYDDTLAAVPLQLRERITVFAPTELSDVGVVLDGADLFIQPQVHIGAGYELLGALAAGLPVIHFGSEAVAELTLDAGVLAGSAAELHDAITRFSDEPGEREKFRVLALDRSRSFSWTAAAWQLWEVHADL